MRPADELTCTARDDGEGALRWGGRPVGSASVLQTAVGLTILKVSPTQDAPDDLVVHLVQLLTAPRPPRLQHFGIRRLRTLRWYQSSDLAGAVVSGVLHGRPMHDMPLDMLALRDGEGLVNLTLHWEDGYGRMMHAATSVERMRWAWYEASERARGVLLRRAVLDARWDRGDLWSLHMVAMRDVQAQVRLYASKHLLRNHVWEPDVGDMFRALDEPLNDPLGVGLCGDLAHTRRNVRTAIVYILGRLVSSARSSSAIAGRRQGAERVHQRLMHEAPRWSADDDRSCWRAAVAELQGGPFATGRPGPLSLFALCRTLVHRRRVLHRLNLVDGDRLSWLYVAVVELCAGLDPSTRAAVMADSPGCSTPTLTPAQRAAIARG